MLDLVQQIVRLHYNLMYINLLGEKVDRNTKGEVLIDIYSNGKTIKRLNLTK